MKFSALIPLIFFLSCSTSHAAEKIFTLQSSDIKPNSEIAEKHVFNGFGCSGKNMAPQISWMAAPADTKSFAFTVYDPDAPTTSGWWHWLVANIPASYKNLPADFSAQDSFTLKDGIVQVRNDFGTYKFGGPCPPQGDKPHRYIFTIYALKVEKLDLNDKSTAALASFMINKNTIAKATFTARYGR